MVRIDSFESVFRAADKKVYAYERPQFERGLILTDLDETEAYAYSDLVKSFLSVLSEKNADLDWDVVVKGEYSSLDELLAIVAERGPDLVCGYRHLGHVEWRSTYTLGDAIETLTQVIDAPIMILPHPLNKRDALMRMQNTNVVMALTDHLAGDSHLVNHAANFVEPSGTLHLSHVEDEAAFARYMDVISKLPSIDTDSARIDIQKRLLREPRDFIESCAIVLNRAFPNLHVEQHIGMGRHLTWYRQLIEEHNVDLLVMNTKDEDQLAMHGLAYPIAVQMSDTPLLML